VRGLFFDAEMKLRLNQCMNTALQKYIFSLLGKREYSTKKLKQKSLEKGYSLEEVGEVIQWMEERNFVNNHRFAEIIIRSYHGKKGKVWIARKMMEKGIEPEVSSPLLDEYEEEISEETWDKVKRKYKFENLDDLEYKERAKVYSWLQRNGFSLFNF
jgi:regulatory protein